MKKFATLSLALLMAAAIYANPNQRVLRSFETTFTTAQNVRWVEHSGMFTASFTYSGIQTRVSYDKYGTILRTIRYYEPSMLPLNIYTRLKREQGGRKLYGVTELSEGDSIVYFVKVESARHWTTLKVDAAGNSEVTERYRKA
jgi:hypothetical protein